ncbi:MAG: trypsin-like peptidase domain-containing protein [Clostridiales bacterium]|nr:trypsin-like peptidase domain-containing protein [Clostridiales bacterium]
MSDNYNNFNDNGFDESNNSQSNTAESDANVNSEPASDFSASSTDASDNSQFTPDSPGTASGDLQFEAESTPQNKESSYEWNAGGSSSSGEYHYSYVNGNNENAAHNPNNYDNAYSSAQYSSTNNSYGYSNTGSQDTTSGQSSYNGYSQQSPYGNYAGNQYQNPIYGNTPPHMNTQQVKKAKVKKPKVKKPKKPVTRGALAAVVIIAIVFSAACGFGGEYIANQLTSSSDGSLNINKVEASNTSSDSDSESSSGLTSEIVKKTANSVVEIATESVVTGSFAQQYVQSGAGSGVIISEDGYIITNYHVIEDANTITVTLRDGTTYDATIIGSDEDNDIALLKVEAEGLSPATFGDSSSLEVGDYVVAIGNPLGELGGTVTDGIISALAREVTIDDNSMTLLQTNAQVSPGNSGGGLFNSDGELVGIVNAKDSDTEVEGIAFAIPINNVLDIISDLKTYGYVTGKIDLGMQLTDITNESAFYYSVSQTGCYVLSVTSGSNAATAGFIAGDLITSVNGTEVTSSSEVESVLEDFEVGDTVTFTVYRSGQTVDIDLVLEEYTPSGSTANGSSTTATSSAESDNSIWSQMFGW